MLLSMNWSLRDYTAPLDAEEIYNQMWERNGLDVAVMGYCGMDGCSGMVESSVFDPHENDVEGSGSIVHRNERGVDRKESNVDGSLRDVNGKESIVDGSSRDVKATESIVDGTFHGTADLAHSIYELATLARKRFAQLFQPGRKLLYTPPTLL